MSEAVLSELTTTRDPFEFAAWVVENLMTGRIRMALAFENGTFQSKVIVPENMSKENVDLLIEGLADFFEATAIAIRSDLKTERGESSGDS